MSENIVCIFKNSKNLNLNKCIIMIKNRGEYE